MEVNEGEKNLVQRFYNQAQLNLIMYMTSTGVVLNPREYAEKYAGLFAELAHGKLSDERPAPSVGQRMTAPVASAIDFVAERVKEALNESDRPPEEQIIYLILTIMDEISERIKRLFSKDK